MTLSGTPRHVPVLLQEVVEGLRPAPGGRYIDGTVGLAGHARALLAASAPDGRLLAIDRDPEALAIARRELVEFGDRVTFARGQFRDLAELARRAGMDGCDGILLDLGVSSLQLDRPERGFSFREEGPLDMRMGPDAPTTAEEIVNAWPEEEVARLIGEYGEERRARRVARAIVAARPIRTTTELADVVARAVGRTRRIHPATRTFQAIRIAVNDELGSLEAALPQAVGLLRPGGRLAVIAFHSLEDRVVKRFIARESRDCVCPPRVPVCVCGHPATLTPITKKPVRATADEVARNPRSRSARLRIAERLQT